MVPIAAYLLVLPLLLVRHAVVDPVSWAWAMAAKWGCVWLVRRNTHMPRLLVFNVLLTSRYIYFKDMGLALQGSFILVLAHSSLNASAEHG